MSGWLDVWKCFVACWLGEESQQLSSPAGQTQAQVHQGAADLDTLAAARGRLRINLSDLINAVCTRRRACASSCRSL